MVMKPEPVFAAMEQLQTPGCRRIYLTPDGVPFSMAIAEQLYNAHPKGSEGDLTLMKHHLVSTLTLARLAEAMGIGEFIRVGRGEEKTGGRKKQALLANTLEAVIAATRERVKTALEIVSLSDRARHKPSELSGGQQQRVAIARAIVSDPKLLLCDEPTGDLDRETAGEILSMLQTLNRDLGKTIVMVTHDPEAARFAKRTLHLDKGRFSEKDLSA